MLLFYIIIFFFCSLFRLALCSHMTRLVRKGSFVPHIPKQINYCISRCHFQRRPLPTSGGSWCSDPTLLWALGLGSGLREKIRGLLWMMHGNVWKRLWTDRAMAAVAISQMTCAGSEGGGSQGEGQEMTGGRSAVGGGLGRSIRGAGLTMPLSTKVLMTVPNRPTSFWTSEEPVGVSGTFWMTSRVFQLTGEKFSCGGRNSREKEDTPLVTWKTIYTLVIEL